MSQDIEGTPGGASLGPATVAPIAQISQDINFDLTHEGASNEARRVGFAHLQALAARPASSDRRQTYFETITIPAQPCIADVQIEALESLTRDGRNVAPFASELADFLIKTLKDLFSNVERVREGSNGSNADLNFWRTQSNSSRPQSDIRADRSRDIDRERISLVREPSGAEKALLDTFYLITNMLQHNPDSFVGPQLKSLVDAVLKISKSTTMRRALRGSLKILIAITEFSRLPEGKLRPVVFNLCAVLGNRSFKFKEEAWTCLARLLKSQDCDEVASLLFDLLVKTSDIPESRQAVTLHGALLCVQRLARSSDEAILNTQNLDALMHCMASCYDSPHIEVTDLCETFLALLSNKTIMQSVAHNDWDIIRHKLDQADESRRAQRSDFARTPSQVLICSVITASSPFYGFVHGYWTKTSGSEPEDDPRVEAIGNKILALLDVFQQDLSLEKAHLALRTLLHLAQAAPVLIAATIDKMMAFSLFELTQVNWSAHLHMAISFAGTGSSVLEQTTTSVLEIFSKIYPSLRQHPAYQATYEGLLFSLCSSALSTSPLPLPIVNSLINLFGDIGASLSLRTFVVLLQVITTECGIDSSKTSLMDAVLNLPDCLLRLFLSCYRQSYFKTNAVYGLLLKVLKLSKLTTTKLRIASLLSRLRCDSDYAMKITSLPEPQDIASNLCRSMPLDSKCESLYTPSKRPSLYGQDDPPRTGRSSAININKISRSRSATRSRIAKDRRLMIVPPQWVQDGSAKDSPQPSALDVSLVVYAANPADNDSHILDLGQWLDFAIEVLNGHGDWELYTFILVHLPLQLSNCSLFRNQVRSLQILHSTLITQLGNGDFEEPPKDSGIRKGDVALCLYQVLVILVPYHYLFGRRMADDTIRTFRIGAEKWDRTAKTCIHALALCCHEMPQSIERHINGITEMMQKRITQNELAVDILEFLGCLVRTPEAYASAEGAFYRRIFAICVRYLQHTWETRYTSTETLKHRSSVVPSRQSGSSAELVQTNDFELANEAHGTSEYVFAIVYQTMIFWFLAIDVRQRAQHVAWLTQELSWKDEMGVDHMHEQSLVILDMMHRTAFSDLGETESAPEFAAPEAKTVKKAWLVGMCILTTELLVDRGLDQRQYGQLTKRQASGTTHAMYSHYNTDLPSHHIPVHNSSKQSSMQNPLDVYPNHMFLQLTSTIAPTPIPLQPIPLPDNDSIRRTIKVFDTIDTVDGHKAGILFVSEGQYAEAEILANTSGTEAYEAFLSGLGTKVPLQGAKYNPQGLDRRNNEDGSHTIAWRDRVTEIVFHVATMMPTDLQDDPQGDKKKRHIGNDHVKIIFNASGQTFEFESFSSAMNTINIVITPESHTRATSRTVGKTLKHRSASGIQDLTKTDRFGHYIIQTLSSVDYPDISFAAEPMLISADAMPAFVRQMAINASVFCQVWQSRGTEYISCWRARLQEIIKLRKKYANTNASSNVHYPMAGADNAASFTEGDTWTGRVTTGGLTDSEKLLHSMDFTRWT